MEADARRRDRVRRQIRAHIPATTALLTVVSLALVFGAVLGYVPDAALPRVEPLVGVVPHANALISAAAITTILTGVRAIRRGNVTRHRRAMLASTALFGLFLVLYLYRVSLEGPTEFTGPDTLRQFLYLPMLAVHILLAMLCLPFVYGALLLAGTHPVAELRETLHPRIGRVAATLWLVSFTLGICVYLLLHVLF
jgi:putative membrane protein